MSQSFSLSIDTEDTEPILSILLPYAKKHAVIDDAISDGTNHTPLYIAIEENRPVAVKLLLKYGADPWVNIELLPCMQHHVRSFCYEARL